MRAVVALIVLAVAASPARADKKANTEALEHLDRGIAAYRLGDYDTAHQEFATAHDLAPDKANPYRWLALTEIKQGNCKDALFHIESFLSRVPVGDARASELVALRTQCVEVTHDQQQPPPPPPPPPPSPIYHRWWFWTAIGAVAATAAGVTYAVTRDPGGVPTLPPLHCDATGCHP